MHCYKFIAPPVKKGHFFAVGVKHLGVIQGDYIHFLHASIFILLQT